MAASNSPQLYLISPPRIERAVFADQLAAILDSFEVACFRLTLASEEADDIARCADMLRETCHSRDVAIVITQHYRLVTRLGLDGCHLTDGARGLRDVRKELGADAIIGSFCGTSRHSGMSAGEAGADYVSFGPLSPSPLGDGEVAAQALFDWWSDMIEVPVVAEGGLTPELVEGLAPVTDFLAVGAEIWQSDDPGSALTELLKPLAG
jgi:thiamine-phosphate pyrophosphorylase